MMSLSSSSSAGLSVRDWTADEFTSSQAAWDGLLEASDADPLFMSWDWQWRWWSHHGAALDATLRIVAFYAGDRLVGLAPLYSHKALVRGLLRPCRLELLGTAWRDRNAVFSDYLDVIAARSHREAVVSALAEWLAGQPFWDELVLCCTRRDGAASDLVRRLTGFTRVREVDGMSAWRARLPESFGDYVERLDSGVRRRFFNHRRKLAEPILQFAEEADVPEYLSLLLRYSAERWGANGPDRRFQAFHPDVAARMARAGFLRLSRLVTRDGVLSVMYNIRVADTIYYLQSGFDPQEGHRLSPGYLHFGYAIESACREGARWFDFLAGSGQHRDYKQDFLTECVPVATYHAVRGRLPRALYATYEAVTGCREILRQI